MTAPAVIALALGIVAAALVVLSQHGLGTRTTHTRTEDPMPNTDTLEHPEAHP
ncbi:hypothetical protein [Streptomyces sp. DH12]|uniref:hypothetical protein n=1 Tax=Streptomyces sp. DH12 TaxID=2857010 RepID=UPI001E2F2CB2|nr:hypothetical protein [Streptomyces sp. DH12]